MRILPSFLIFVIALAGRLFAQNSDPIAVTGTIPAQSIVQPVGTPPIDLSGFFAIPTLTGKTVLQFTAGTSLSGTGTPITQKFNVVMDSTGVAPNTVANFLKYVNGGLYSNSIIHRSDQPLGIIQGGGFLNDPNLSSMVPLQNCSTISGSKNVTCQSTSQAAIGMTVTGTQIPAGATITSITNGTTLVISAAATSTATGQTFTIAYPPIALETATDTLLNARGAIAMARTNSLNSATSEWFINTKDNSSALPPASASGYAAFGRVTGTGMTVVDAIQALPLASGTLTATSTTVSGTVTVTQSATNSAAVFVNSGTLPNGFGTGWVLLGSYVNGVVGNLVTLTQNANQTITTATQIATNNPTGVIVVPSTVPTNFGAGWGLLDTTVYNYDSNSGIVTLQNYPNQTIASNTVIPWTRLGDPFTQLPLLANLPADNSVQLANLVTVNSIAPVPLFPPAPGAASVVTFSAVSANPSVVSASVSGSNLYIAAASNLTTTSPVTITVTATDTNGNTNQTPCTFKVSVTRKVVDFNNDGTPDLVFQNNLGQIYSWTMNSNGSVASGTYLFTGGLGDWKLKAIADLNGDGIPDFIFQNTIGQIYAWYLTPSGSVSSGGYIFTGALGDWKLAGTADLNRDGKTDLVFQNTIGQIYVWYMNGNGVVSSGGYFYGGGLGDWKLQAIADVNGDGNADFIFQNNAGQIYVWYTTATGTVSTGAFLYSGGLGDWKLARATDLNKDGTTDFIFQNNAGQISVWYLTPSGSTSSGGYIFSGSLGDWRLQ